MRIVLAIIFTFTAVGCTSQAGPYVTNISSDGRGGLTVEKCMMVLNRSITTVENSNCTNTNIALTQTAGK
jgi:type IV secretion system protein VirB7